MELGFFQPKRLQLYIGDFDPCWIGGRIELGLNLKTRLGLSIGDQIHDHLVARQGLATPILGDVRKHPLLDFVPLAGAGWKMATRDVQPALIGPLLQLLFPASTSPPLAAATGGGNEQFTGLGVGLLSHLMPPLPDGLNRKLCRVMVSPDADPTWVGRQVINPRGYPLTVRKTQEVIDLDFFRMPLGLILPSALGECTDQFFLLGVYRDHRLALPLEGPDRLIEVRKLRIPIRMRTPFWGLAGTW